MIKPAIFLAVVLCGIGVAAQAAAADAHRRTLKTPTGYLVVLRRGDNVLEKLESLAREEKIPSASLSGIGFFGEVTFGFYNFEKKAFDAKTFRDVELLGLTGTIAWKDGKPSIHVHGTVAGRDFQAVGGHILAGEVGTGTMEITVIAHDTKLERKIDPEIGANVLQLGD